MALATGQLLSFYELIAPLGAGSMGEVWRARDTRLEREVAIKVLPAQLADDAERLRRFEREAKVLASLNHPNVGAIHGVDCVDELWFLALELVPGEDLAATLARGPLSIEEALDVARQIADGLEAAHQAGVIHRDLKPANVQRTPEGLVKVLDFGLAKVRAAPEAADASDSALRSEAGLVLGTPTYMAPEQALGRPIDRRVDLWALGCVLFECLSGRRAFGGGSLAEVLNAVLEREPDWSALPARTPARVRELLERCLAKDPRQRQRDAGDARLEIERALAERAWTGAVAAGAPRSSGRPGAVALGALALGAVLGAGLYRGLRSSPPVPQRELRLSLVTSVPFQRVFPRIAPDGTAVVHEATLAPADGEPDVRALFRRDLDAFESVPLPGTENPTTFGFSPDGEHLAVLVELSGRGGELTLMKVALRGESPPVRLGPWPRQHKVESAIAWLPGGHIVGGARRDRLIRYRLEGGETEVLEIQRSLENSGEGVDVFRALDDGRSVLARTYYYGERGYMAALVALDVHTGVERVVLRDAEYGALPAPDRLLFTRGEVLFETSFDPETLSAGDTARPIADGLRTVNAWRSAWFDLARDGTLIWLPGGRQGTKRFLSVLEPDGEVRPFLPERLAHDGAVLTDTDGESFTTMMVSEDGKRVELWGSRVDQPNLVPLMAAPGTDFLVGLRVAGGRDLIYRRVGVAGQQGIFRARIDAPEEAQLLISTPPSGPAFDPVAVTRDEAWLVVGQTGRAGVQYSTLSLTDPDLDDLRPLVHAGDDQFWPKVSTDGLWLAYVLEEVDRKVLYAQRLEGRDPVGPRLRVPTPDGEVPWDYTWWREPEGRNAFLMVAVDRQSLFSTPLEVSEDGTEARCGRPQPIATVPDAYVLDLAPLSGGRALLLLQDPQEEQVDQVAVVIGALARD